MIGPVSTLGRIEFGSATDGRRVYVAESDFFGTPYQITSAYGTTTTITGGSWTALDAATGSRNDKLYASRVSPTIRGKVR